jgi:NAD(P)H-hydrate epimerase
MWIASAHRSREIDRLATTKHGIPASVLMERAGLAVFEAVRQLLPDGGSLAVVCGGGSNGGDGLVAARLAAEAGYGVECLVACHESGLSKGAATQVALARAMGLQPVFHGEEPWDLRMGSLGRHDLIVDALLGTGAKGEVQGPVRDAIRAINGSGIPVVSVDVPSGIDCDTGEELGESVWALRTVTFGLPKPFLFQGIGLEHSGYWTVADIGFPAQLLNEPTGIRLVDAAWVANLLPERLRAGHKGDNGNVLVVAGSRDMPGAALLAARGALRSGAGLVTVASVPRVCDTLAAHLPEAMAMPLPEENGAISPAAAGELIASQDRWDAVLFGPGMTHGPGVLDLLRSVWQHWQVPSCIDADALNTVSLGVAPPAADCVLTPHPGEMGRLMQASTAEVQANRFGIVAAATERYSKTVLLKGAYSIAGERGQPLAVNSTGNPGMATGGMGDVLAGMVAVLLAQQLPPFCAAACAAYWHGAAGDLCADEIGPVGYRAGEVADALPQARAKLCGTCARE